MATKRNSYTLRWWLVRKLTGGSIEVDYGTDTYVVTLAQCGRRNSMYRKSWWR